MRFGLLLNEPKEPDVLGKLRERIARAADDGFSSVWMSNIFGLDALTAPAPLRRRRRSVPPRPFRRRSRLRRRPGRACGG